MNLKELKERVDRAYQAAFENEDEAPEEVTVSIQIDLVRPQCTIVESIWSKDIELHYDGNCQASGCVIVGSKGGW